MRVLRLLLPALCGAALALVGCGDNESIGLLPRIPVPGCEAHDHDPCDVRTPACQTRLFALAACLYGEPTPGDPPPTSVITEADFAAMLTAEAANDTPAPHQQEIEDAFGLFHLVERRAFSPSTTVAESAKSIWGLYRPGLADILLIDHGDAFDHRSASVVLIHEFIHALQDREVSLLGLEILHGATDDAFRAAVSVVEGEARMHEDRYAASVSGYDPSEIDFLRRTQNRIDRLLATLPDAKSPYTTTSRQFPYVWGARYMQLTAQAGGREATRARLTTPPNGTLTLLTSETTAQDPLPLPPPLAPPSAPPEWTLIDETVLGAWGALLILARDTGDVAGALAAAQKMAGDGLWIYTHANGGVAIVWRADFFDEASATAARTLLAARPSLPTVMRRATGVTAALTNARVSLDWAIADTTAAYNPSSGATAGITGVISSGTRPERRAVRIGKWWPTRAPTVGSMASVL